jgi:hypothetical protein
VDPALKDVLFNTGEHFGWVDPFAPDFDKFPKAKYVTLMLL